MLTNIGPETMPRTAGVELGSTPEQVQVEESLRLALEELRLLEEDSGTCISLTHIRAYLCHHAEVFGLDTRAPSAAAVGTPHDVPDLPFTPKPDAGSESVAPTASGPALSGRSAATSAATEPLTRRPRSRQYRNAPDPASLQPADLRPVREVGWASRFASVAVAVLTAVATVGLYLLLFPTGAGPRLVADVAARMGWNVSATSSSPHPEPLPAPPTDVRSASPVSLEPDGDAPESDAASEIVAPPVVAPAPASPTGPAAPATHPTVEVLDGSGSREKLDVAVKALRGLGYDIIATGTVPGVYFSSVVLTPAGHEDQAAALVAADPRFGAVRPAPHFAVPADLHVIIGSNWP